jgi:predicted  nucleic acid-binding Zn-ribbon protein
MSLLPHTCQKCGAFWCDDLPISICPECGDDITPFTTEQSLGIIRLIRQAHNELHPHVPVDPQFELTDAGRAALEQATQTGDDT